jgi:hypothetical protein
MFNDADIHALRTICVELGHPCTAAQANSIGQRVLRFILATEVVKPLEQPNMTSEEETVFYLILSAQEEGGKAPSVRDMSAALGYSSSRSGWRIWERLITKGLVARNEDGKVSPLWRRQSAFTKVPFPTAPAASATASGSDPVVE